MTNIISCPTDQWTDVAQANLTLLNDLEHGNVLFFPKLGFELSPQQQVLLEQPILKGKNHYVHYDPRNHQLKGHKNCHDELYQLLRNYCSHSKELVTRLFPLYENRMSLGHTCFIPADHQRQPRDNGVNLHIDSFRTSPLHGKRILRIYTNISPDGQTKTWHVGEPFNKIMQRFAKQIKKPFLLKLLLSKRSVYDYFMLQLNRMMKNDKDYQQQINPVRFDFPASSSWMAFTDQVSHASLNGRHTLAQTFYLPISSLQNPQLSPLTLLENYLDHALI
ncbi:MAG: Kdo hydroxylase family protein [Coxiellaceae bacterium]|nr:Kdo hydroxylase family protein [Coxiellaceae bacterium]